MNNYVRKLLSSKKSETIAIKTLINISLIFLIYFFTIIFIMPESWVEGLLVNRIRLSFQLIALIFGGIGIYIALLNYNRKSFNKTESYTKNISYISKFSIGNYNNQFFIINLKDRVIIVFEIIIKFKNVSITLPFDYPIKLNNYGAEGCHMNRIDDFLSYKKSGFFEVKSTTAEYENMDTYGHPNTKYSGDIFLKELIKGEFQVYASTNICEHPILLQEQKTQPISQSNIHIDKIQYSKDPSFIDKEIESDFYSTLEPLHLEEIDSIYAVKKGSTSNK